MGREGRSNTERWGVKRRKEQEAKENGKEPPEKENQERRVSWKNVFQSGVIIGLR